MGANQWNSISFQHICTILFWQNCGNFT
jgi:hypothetical protein